MTDSREDGPTGNGLKLNLPVGGLYHHTKIQIFHEDKGKKSSGEI